MKLEVIKPDTKKEFKPFELKITVETIQEARLFYHVFNNTDLRNSLQKTDHYDFGTYSNDIAFNLCNNSSGKIISNTIESQGFEV